MSTQCGTHDGASIVTTGDSGFLLFGPHRALSQGTYEASIFGKVGPHGCAGSFAEVAINNGDKVLAEVPFALLDDDERIAVLKFKLDQPYMDIEIRVRVTYGTELNIFMVKVACIEPFSKVACIATDLQTEKV